MGLICQKLNLWEILRGICVLGKRHAHRDWWSTINPAQKKIYGHFRGRPPQLLEPAICSDLEISSVDHCQCNFKFRATASIVPFHGPLAGLDALEHLCSNDMSRVAIRRSETCSRPCNRTIAYERTYSQGFRNQFRILIGAQLSKASIWRDSHNVDRRLS